MVPLFLTVLLFSVLMTIEAQQTSEAEYIKRLVVQWAPLIWMSPKEKYFPSSVDAFLDNVHIADENGRSISATINETQFRQIETKSLFLATKDNLNNLRAQYSFLNGHHPKRQIIPMYATISICSAHSSFRSSDSNSIRNDIDIIYGITKPQLYFHVTYWAFYPYNKGKDVCFIGKVPAPTIFGRCFGHLKTIGSHVGDWEHMSLSFKGRHFPSEIYLSVHDTGGFYKFEPHRNFFKLDTQRVKTRAVQRPKFPPVIRMQNGHPVLFAAEGSHGLWSAPGEHEYVKIPHLTDKCGYGVPWKTWEDVVVFNVGEDEVPAWMEFKGRWGNPTTNCVLSRKLGLCEHTDGPPGILRTQQEFRC